MNDFIPENNQNYPPTENTQYPPQSDAAFNNPYGNNPYGNNQYGNNPYNAPVYGAGQPYAPISREEFFETQATSFKKDIKGVLIICYICIVVTAIVAVAFGAYFGLIDAALLLGVTLGLQFKKKKGFAYGILGLAIFEVVMSIIAGSFSGYLWIAAGVSAVMAFRKAEKEYNAYLAGFGIAPQK